MTTPGYRDVPPESWDPDAPVDLAEAEDFLRMCYAENSKLGSAEPRLAVVRAQIAATGTYVHTPDELAYGARVAWRNSSRCIGRLYWRSLVVLDRRRARTPEEIFALIVRHLCMAGGTAAANREPGAIRPVISIFPQAQPGRPYARIWNEQLIRYAGYRDVNGGVTGDPRVVRFTESMRDLGWRGKGDAFDVLPVAIETPAHGVRLFELPERAVLEVPLAHPEFGWFAELGLRWHAVPAISNMRLTIGGVHYPLAPFNGWYMGTEIGARNLADPERYNMVPVVARLMGLDTSKPGTLWRDRALVELNRAVLWSFERAGVKITDHHTESDRFMAHIRNETRAGREVPADWSWIVPPLSGGATQVFHHYYHEADERPNFYLDPEARALATHGHRAHAPTEDPTPPTQTRRETTPRPTAADGSETRVAEPTPPQRIPAQPVPPAAPSRVAPSPTLRPACPVRH
ncbi:nitric-oxide synthase [Asanoa hainanensis]|uniref:Nitric-oxide synthase n=1 Tax=Asanoa hainanensis TaxID=560556 RepID=A0A239JWV5_9ACTN|nr:nitric oxide synthase oxygenase [Asanoa hainanensis]SNT09972.1 nitric-oxide synthase [Asanoa hainanensis]